MTKMIHAAVARLLPLAAALLVAAAHASMPLPPELVDCAAIESGDDRLACYDRILRPQSRPAAAATPAGGGQAAAAAPAVPPAPPAPPAPAAVDNGPLGERWAIDRGARILVRPHEPTYLLVGRYSNAVNQRPASPTRPAGPVDLGLDDLEAKYQLSFKFRLVDFDAPWAPDLWFGYTQQSHWQVYNDELSRPFRETNYAPELILGWNPDVALGGWRWRVANVGLLHQSNGRSTALSRSWNRVYAQFGIERDDWLLLVRPWVRLGEDGDDDDNPDIVDYLGHGDVVLSYRRGEQVVSGKARYNVGTGRGYVEGSWTFPLLRGLNGYLQATSGYGESLIDYNARQTTIGLGVSLYDWQ
jgi:phospholipase A1